MLHTKSDHFLDKSKRSYDNGDNSLKIYVFIKYIGEGITHSSILQLGYISNIDQQGPSMIAVKPEDELSTDLMKALRYDRKSSGKMKYTDFNGEGKFNLNNEFSWLARFTKIRGCTTLVVHERSQISKCILALSPKKAGSASALVSG